MPRGVADYTFQIQTRFAAIPIEEQVQRFLLLSALLERIQRRLDAEWFGIEAKCPHAKD